MIDKSLIQKRFKRSLKTYSDNAIIQKQMAKKWVYMFSEGDMSMRNLLGGKGANLAEMSSIGLPVPQGFTITTEACTQYYEDGRKINDEIMGQAMAEFSDRLKERRLSVVMKQDGLDNPHILADSRSLWRVMENLFVNVCKYAMMGSRVFIDISNTDTAAGQRVSFKLRNVSENPLPDDITELTERFIRGDESRTSDGSGLGLSIAKSLTELMGGTFTISSEADVFTGEIGFNSAI